MNTLRKNLQTQLLLKIKRAVDYDNNGDKFVIIRTRKNIEFIRNYNLTLEDIKNVIRQLSTEDCFAGPEDDRDTQYKGWILKFCPMYNNIKLYIKIRIENLDKSICLSIHEFGKYDEVK